MKNAKVVGCAVGGFFVGGIGGVLIATTWIWPTSNMAGRVVLATAPLGFLLGLFVGKVWADREKK